jgi:NAD(P) transhydrogenase subunit alpha
MIVTLKKSKYEVFVETGAGLPASFTDREYQEAGATIVQNGVELYRASEVVLKFQPPRLHPQFRAHEAELISEHAALISFMEPHVYPEAIRKLAARRITCFAMDYVPRITRAQSMDALSSISTIIGYKAVLVAAYHLGKFFPLLMTAAGTIPPANVVILGAGVAGLQAIATARRLGAKVEAFDPRPAVKEQVKSLGAQFIEMEIPEDIETVGGYAKEQSEVFLQKERDAIASRLPKMDIVITTAQVFGKRAPRLITADMVKLMRPGSVIVDLAADQGGNCELSEPHKTIVKHRVTIIGVVNLANTMPVHASQMYSKNIVNLFLHLYKSPDGKLDFSDEITKGACLTHEGEIVNESVKKILQGGGIGK